MLGPHTGDLVAHILESRPHPEQGYRACLGLLGLARTYGPERVEAACARALRSRATSYRSVKSILEHALDRVGAEDDQITLTLPADHVHVRGPTYYATLTTE